MGVQNLKTVVSAIPEIWTNVHHPKQKKITDNVTIRYSAYSPLIATACQSCTIFKIQQDIHWKSQIFPSPHVSGIAVGDDPLEFHWDLQHQKTRLSRLSWSVFVW